MRRRRYLTAALVVLAAAAVLGLEHDATTIQPLHGDKVLLGEEVGAVAVDTVTDQQEAQARQQFMKIITKIGSTRESQLTLNAISLARDTLGQGQAPSMQQNSAMNTLFTRLDEMLQEMATETTDETTKITLEKQTCAANIANADALYLTNQAIVNQDITLITHHSAIIKEEWTKWFLYYAEELAANRGIEDLQKARQDASDIQSVAMNDQNAAIDVLIEATFLVCEKFARYKGTLQCREIQAQPDVVEPDHFESKEPDEAKLETELTHTLASSHWLQNWTQRIVTDRALEGQPDPEDLLVSAEHRNQITSNTQITEDTSVRAGDPRIRNDPPPSSPPPAPSERERAERESQGRRLGQAAEEAEVSELGVQGGPHEVVDLGEDVALNSETVAQEEAQALVKLSGMVESAKLDSKYTLLLKDLVLTLQTGQQRSRSKSIVDVLLNIIKQIRAAQDEAAAQHTLKLDTWYTAIDGQVDGLMNLRNSEQVDAKDLIVASQTIVSAKVVEIETARQAMDQAFAERTGWENDCTSAETVYVDGESERHWTSEDVLKLKSMLRMLYNREQPILCPKFNHVICTGSEQGLCIFTHNFATSMDTQRCSCFEGYYGDACQYKMCPGFATAMYEEHTPGVCSGRGMCNKLTGTCTCNDPIFYHGPKNACEYKHSPPSSNGQNDELCSMHGVTDKVRGRCDCHYGWGGPGCEEMWCPSKEGVLYPKTAGPVCSARGACNPATGQCMCDVHFFSGDKGACEEGTCGLACNHHGSCNHMTAECTCDDVSYGMFCQHRYCPMMIDSDCSEGGKCNRNNGMCMCKMGFSGPICSGVDRCTASRLNNEHMNWWTVWDQPGWLLCPPGQLLYQLERSTCLTLPDPGNDPLKAPSTGGALSCIESGGCAAPCETSDPVYVFQMRHCYHELRWYNWFDMAGWSKCRQDYYIAGLYRTCESLYCLNMVKCCSLDGGEAWSYTQAGTTPLGIPLGNTHESRYVSCGEATWGTDFSGETPEQLIGTVPTGMFITGLKRGEGHTLADIEAVSYCGFIRGY